MSYTMGIAGSIGDLRAALVAACELAGWVWDSGAEVLSKGNLHARLQIDGVDLTLLGRTSAGGGDAPNVVRIGRMLERAGYPTWQIVFPATYELFVFDDPDEVYLVVNSDVGRYQWMAFGRSPVQSLPGTGMWVGATVGGRPGHGSTYAQPISISPTSGGANWSGTRAITSAALAYSTAETNGTDAARNFMVHSGLDSQGWAMTQNAEDKQVGISALVPLIGCQPSEWNSEAVLLPIRGYKIRPENRISLVADMQHARHVRVDNYEPGQIIALGEDRWKVYPWHRKNLAERDGIGQPSSAGNIDHTGTMGWAIRYEGE